MNGFISTFIQTSIRVATCIDISVAGRRIENAAAAMIAGVKYPIESALNSAQNP